MENRREFLKTKRQKQLEKELEGHMNWLMKAGTVCIVLVYNLLSDSSVKLCLFFVPEEVILNEEQISEEEKRAIRGKVHNLQLSLCVHCVRGCHSLAQPRKITKNK